MPLPRSFKIVLGVTGGIAAYKACELVRLFRTAGHEVRVVMTAQAEAFVGPVTFHSLSGNPVLRSLGTQDYDLSATSHIDLARWGEILVVAPATANFLAKYRAGISDDALLTEALAFQGPVLIAPAMNTRMWEAPATRENHMALTARGVHFAGPIAGDLACGEVGEGKMIEPAFIFREVMKLLEKAESVQPLKGLKVVVTSGPTRSYIDSIRYITNRSSGRMGHALAGAALEMGAEVTLVTGPVEPRFADLPGAKVIAVETAEEMHAAAASEMQGAALLFATAAVGDFAPRERIQGKLPRAEKLQLELEPTRDVVAALAEQKTSRQVFFGFAAESAADERAFARAREKLARKRLDLLALNDVSRPDIGFDAEANEFHLFDSRAPENPELLPKDSKFSLARRLVEKAHARWRELQA